MREAEDRALQHELVKQTESLKNATREHEFKRTMEGEFNHGTTSSQGDGALDELEKTVRMKLITPEALNKIHDLLDHLAEAPMWREFVGELRAMLPARD